jgi:hypothetical protein
LLIAQNVSSDTPLIIWSSKTVIAASGFYIRLWLPAAVMAEWERERSHDSCRQPQTYVKTEAAITVLELLMMSGVSPETF